MKRTSTFKVFLTGILIITGLTTFAQSAKDSTSLTVSMYPAKTGDKIYIHIEKLINRTAAVQLLTKTGEELFVEQLPKKEAKFRQTFDLNELTDGTYLFRITQGEEVIIKSIQVKSTVSYTALPDRKLTVGI